jgi:hypothetical protein
MKLHNCATPKCFELIPLRATYCPGCKHTRQLASQRKHYHGPNRKPRKPEPAIEPPTNYDWLKKFEFVAGTRQTDDSYGKVVAAGRI